MSLGNLPQPPSYSNKREYDSETPLSTPSPPSSSQGSALDGPRIIAGSRRVSPKDKSLSPASSASSKLLTPLPTFDPLPIHSHDLGRLPIPMYDANGIPLSEANNAWFPTPPNNFSRFGQPGPPQPSPQSFSSDDGMQMDSSFLTIPQNQNDGSKGQNLHSLTEASTLYQSHLPVDPNSRAGMGENPFDLWNNLPFEFE